MRLADRAPCRQYKKRHLKHLSHAEVEEIIATAKRPGWQMKDVAQKHRVPRDLVGRLCREAAEEPEKLAARHQRREILEEKKGAIVDVTAGILQRSQPIARAQQVQLAVEEQKGLEVSTQLVRQVFRKELYMGYRVAKAVAVQSNSERALVLR